VIEWFTKLWTDLVGESIVTDIKDGIVEIWKYLFDKETGIFIVWVKTAIAVVLGFFTDLWGKLISNEDSIFNKIKDGIVTIWDDLFGEEGFLREGLTGLIEFIEGLWQRFKDAGSSLISGFFSGIKAKWDTAKEVLGDAWQWVQDQLPGSEPKDPSSPFAGLEKRGAAIMDNMLAGMRGVDFNGAVQAQLSGAVTGAPTVNVNVPEQTGEGLYIENLNLPNVENAEDLITELQALTVPGVG